LLNYIVCIQVLESEVVNDIERYFWFFRLKINTIFSYFSCLLCNIRI